MNVPVRSLREISRSGRSGFAADPAGYGDWLYQANADSDLNRMGGWPGVVIGRRPGVGESRVTIDRQMPGSVTFSAKLVRARVLTGPSILAWLKEYLGYTSSYRRPFVNLNIAGLITERVLTVDFPISVLSSGLSQLIQSVDNLVCFKRMVESKLVALSSHLIQ